MHQVTVLCLHQTHHTPIFRIIVDTFNIGFDSNIDHGYIYGNLGNTQLFDMLNYPFTYLPSDYNPKLIRPFQMLGSLYIYIYIYYSNLGQNILEMK